MKLKSFILLVGFVLISNFLYAGGGKGKDITKALEIALSKKAPVANRPVKTPKSTLPGAKTPAKAQVPTAKNTATKAAKPTATPKVSAAATQVAPQAKTVGMFPTARIFKQGYHTIYLSHEQAEGALSVKRGKEILEGTLDGYISAQDPDTEKLKQYIMEQYLKIAGSEHWEIAWYEKKLLNEAKEKGFDVSVVPAEVMQVLAAMTIREYVIKNGAKFPKFGENKLVDYVMMDTIWHKALHNELAPEAQLVLAESFVASSTRSVSEIAEESQEYGSQHNMLPGFAVFGSHYKIAYYRHAGGTPDVLTEEAKKSVVLGTEYVIAVKILPIVTEYPDEYSAKYATDYEEQMDSCVKYLEEVAPIKKVNIDFTYGFGHDTLMVY